MTWRTQYEPGSFRGATFRTEGHERSGGRRIALHEFPGRDEPLSEDLGRRARGFSIDCHVLGEDYRTQRDALIDALEGKGPGLLVHPWHGRMMVTVLDFTQSESTDAGGMASFRIEFGEAGQAVSAVQTIPAGQETAIEAKKQHENAPEAFKKKFSIEDAAGFVEKASQQLISGMVEVTQFAASLQGGSGPALRAFEAGLRYLPANQANLLRAPLNLASAMVGMVSALSVLGSTARLRIAGLARLTDWEPSEPEFPEITPSRVQEAQNRRALLWLFRSAAAAELARAAASAPFASYDDAIAQRDAISARLDRLALAAADRGEDAEADGYDALRRALVRDVAARGSSLARLHSFTLATTEPALVLANRFYGRSSLEARATEIATRNRVAHPGFVPGGRALELLTLQGLGEAA